MENKRTAVGYQVLFLFICVFWCCTQKASAGDQEDWRVLESQVVERQYRKEYIDSIRDVYNVEDQRGLTRQIQGSFPVKKHEKLVFVLSWGFAKAGYAIYESTVEDETIEIEGKAVTNKFVSAFYKVRDYIHGSIDRDNLYPYFFEQHIREKRYRAHRWTMFDHKKGKLYQYKKDTVKSYDIKPFTNDYLTLISHMRMRNLEVGESFTIDCFVHQEARPIKFKVQKKERIEVEAGEFDCIKVRPFPVGEGKGLTKDDKIWMWLTDDERRMPVLIKAKVAVGYIKGKLYYHSRE